MNTIKIPRILLPTTYDLSAWAVNACDQFTSDEEYWRNLYSYVGDKPSALKLILPEIYLSDKPQERIEKINQTMYSYLASGMFRAVEDGFILVERTTQSGKRTGIVLAVDLEDYSYEKGSSALIRSTEATILERIPPRVQIRKDAPIELPHIMLLYDDKENKVLSSVKRGNVLYDFDLNMGGGHLTGTYITNPHAVIDAFDNLCDGMRCYAKYGSFQRLLFAVGDGNHSLATAKACWDGIKETLNAEQRAVHPARYALVEVVNIYDEALKFEPIHRIVKTDKTDLFMKGLNLGGSGKAVVAVSGRRGAIKFPENIPEGIKALDEYISSFIQRNGGEVDYVHGDDELKRLSYQGVGIMLPAIKKEDLFRLIINGGNLPRKTFSMGDGNEKRYYMEAKAIK